MFCIIYIPIGNLQLKKTKRIIINIFIYDEMYIKAKRGCLF